MTDPPVAARYATPPNLYDTIVTMSFVAAVTSRIRLVPSTIVLPLHEPLLLSRQLATLDVFRADESRSASAWEDRQKSIVASTARSTSRIVGR